MDIILASKSPRRRELFSLITKSFTCVASDVDENAVSAADARELCLTLARLKCRDIARRRKSDAVIGCDTVVSSGGRVLGKPRSRDEAREMLTLLSGSAHSVFTGVCLAVPPSGEEGFVCETEVEFFDVSPAEIESYIATDEPYDKAGGYGIQGGAARFVKEIRGDYFNVMGLPVSRLYRLLQKSGVIDG